MDVINTINKSHSLDAPTGTAAMTDTPRALQATYVDLKFIKTRKLVQMVLELPIEQGEAVVQMFGTPRPDESVWVAVARLTDDATVPETGEPKPEFDIATYAIGPSQRAGMLCSDKRFQEWMTERSFNTSSSDLDKTDPKLATNWCADEMRWLCKVKSRAEFDTDPAARQRFEVLESEYLRSLGG